MSCGRSTSSRRRPGTRSVVGGTAALLAFSLLVQFSWPNIPDPDGLYHLGHAAVYRERGLLFADFPWPAFSRIGQTGADLWYGFHLLLLPFTQLRDGIFAAKAAGASLTFASLALFGWSLARLGARLVPLWPLLLAVSSGDTLYRLTMARPHGLTLGLSVAAASLAVRGGAGAILAVSALASFTHLALAWLPPLAVGAVTAVRAARGGAVAATTPAAAAAGALLGALLRPNPWGAVQLAWIQTVDLARLKSTGLPVSFGRELFPPDAHQMVRQVLPTLLLLAAAATALFFLVPRRAAAASAEEEDLSLAGIAAGTLALLFALVSIFVARRGLDLCSAFTVLTAAAAASLALTGTGTDRRPARVAPVAALAALLLLAANTAPVFVRYMHQAWAPDHLRGAALWLRDASRPGEIVFHTRWEHFATLFFWNRANRYINGMDPIFQYDVSPALYWKWHWIAADRAETRTCAKPRCRPEETEDTATVIARDFGASWLLLDRELNPRLYARLERDRVFPKRYDDGRHAVYRVEKSR